MRPFRKLRIAMMDQDKTMADLAPVVGVKTPSNVSDRFVGRTDWKLDEIYAVLDFLKIPAEDMHLYFPRGGQDKRI